MWSTVKKTALPIAAVIVIVRSLQNILVSVDCGGMLQKPVHRNIIFSNEQPQLFEIYWSEQVLRLITSYAC